LIKKLEKENEALKLSFAEKELESRLKHDLLKKVARTEKEAQVRQYMGLGMRRDDCLSIAQL
jgi:hypothetical protein